MQHRSTRTIRCDEGYSPSNGTAPDVVTCLDGKWRPKWLKCDADECQCALPEGWGVESDCDGKVTTQTCVAQCKAGYTPQPGGGDGAYTCLVDGCSIRSFNPRGIYPLYICLHHLAKM